MSAYRLAPEVATIAKELIDAVSEHEPLTNVRIEYLFLDKAPKSKGRLIWGRARRVGGLGSVLANLNHYAEQHCQDPMPLFVVEISEDIWQGLNAERRTALVDHELMHCRVELNDDLDEYVLSTRPHDFEEFASIIRRHGMWTTSSEGMGAAVMEQLALAIDSVDTFVAGLGKIDPETGEIIEPDGGDG